MLLVFTNRILSVFEILLTDAADFDSAVNIVRFVPCMLKHVKANVYVYK